MVTQTSSSVSLWTIVRALAMTACLAAPVARADGPLAMFGSTVAALELRADARTIDANTLWPLIEVEVGGVLESEAVRQTLLNLHAVESVGKAEVRSERMSGGVRVVVVVGTRLEVRSLELVGDLCVRRSLLTGRLQQVEGTPLSESRLVRGVYRLEEALFEAGFRSARVRLVVSVDERERLADVEYRIDCGPASVVGEVAFEGDLGPLAAEDLLPHLRLTGGDRLDESLLGEERDRLQSWLIEAGYRLAKVAGPEQMPGEQAGEVDLVYDLDVGPRVEISVEGADRETLERKGGLGLLDRERFDEALVRVALDNVRRFLQEQGHYDVEIDWTVSDDADGRHLRIFILEGPAYTIGSISFRGNDSIPDEELAARMATSASGGFGAKARLVDEVLEDDLDNLEAFYARQGFGDAEIGPAEVRRNGDRLEVEIPVIEGPRQRLVSLDFEGVESEVVEPRLSDLALVPGGPYHPRLLEETLDAVRAAYEKSGYFWAQVEGSVTSGSEPIFKSVVVRVLEGPQVEVQRIILRGNARTRREVVLRSLGLEPGQTVSRSLLLDAQRRLYRLGVFSQVEVQLAPGMPFSSRRDVLVRVREGRSQRVTFGLGYDSEDGLRSLLGYSHANLAGRAISARLDVRVSERDEIFRALLQQPFAGRWNLPVTYSLFGIEEEKESFDSRRRGFQIEGHRQSGASRLGLLFTYKLVEVLENPDVPLFRLGVDRNLQEADIASITPSLLLDYRDDPLVPTRGGTVNVQGEVAFPALAADTEYTKLFGQYTQHVPLGRFGVVAASARIGLIDSLGGSGGDSSGRIPISEQFFAGGRTTHRAFKRDLLGVLGETLLRCNPDTGACGAEVPPGEDPDDFIFVPVGGNALALFNIDYRFPLVGPLGGTVFVDAGNVWAEWDDIDAADVEVGAGVGVRYLSPIGPLRLEVGWKLDREDDQAPAVIFLSFGNPF